MNIQDIRYRLRKRRLDEIFDFSLLIIRRNFSLMTLYALPAIILIVGLNILILTYLQNRAGDEGSHSGAQQLLLFGLVLFEQPLFALPLILLNGNLVFAKRPSFRDVFSDLLQVLPAYIFRTVLLRTILYTVLAPFIVPIWLSLGRDFFQSEVILLEKLKGRQITRRLSALSWRHTGRNLSFLSMDVTVAMFFVGSGLFAWNQIIDLFGLGQTHWLLRGEVSLFSPIVHLLIFVYAVFHTATKFLYYIDIRSQLEGWDIELMLIKGIRETDSAGEYAR